MPDSGESVDTDDTSLQLPIPSDYEPACAALPHNQKHFTRLQKEMRANIGKKIRKMFLVDDKKQTTDYYESTVHSVAD